MFFKRAITTGLVVAAAVPAPAALAMTDARPAPAVVQDLRSPDARPAPAVVQDLRSPDARDAGKGVVVARTAPVSAPAGRTVAAPGAEFPWPEAGLAAAFALALIALGGGTMRRRHRLASA